MLSEESTVPGFRGFFAEWRLERKDAESAEDISHRDSQRAETSTPTYVDRSQRGGGPRYARHGSSGARFTSATLFLRHLRNRASLDPCAGRRPATHRRTRTLPL